MASLESTSSHLYNRLTNNHADSNRVYHRTPRSDSVPEDIGRYDNLGKPLGPPPLGWIWQKEPDDSWKLIKLAGTICKDEKLTVSSSSIIRHVVLSHDTIQGVCLKYNVSAMILRRYNNFSGTNIQALKYLRVPLEPGAAVTIQIDTHDIILQIFKNETGERDLEARVYLDEAAWNIDRALSFWRGDESWCSDHFNLNFTTASDIEGDEHNHLPIVAAGVVVSPHDVHVAASMYINNIS